MEEKKFIDVQKIIASKNPKLVKFIPRFVINYLKKIIHQEQINQFIKENGHLKNQAFCKAVVKFFKINVSISGIENIPKTGGCTVVMNHPLGGMDALAFVDAIHNHRTDVKFIVNDLLLYLEPIKDLFVGVNKHGKNNTGTHQKIDDLFASDQLICIFPAGLVSRKKKGIIQDLPWKKTFVRLSKKHQKPIIPVHIDGKLSNFFYRLSNFREFLRIKFNIEMLYLSDELFKQENANVHFTIGKPILSNELSSDKNFAKWSDEIRENLYNLQKVTQKHGK
jgi:putative hemolysin